VIVDVFGDDGGATCAKPNSALKRGLLLGELTNGAAGPGARPIIADNRVVQGQLLVMKVYCPDELRSSPICRRAEVRRHRSELSRSTTYDRTGPPRRRVDGGPVGVPGGGREVGSADEGVAARRADRHVGRWTARVLGDVGHPSGHEARTARRHDAVRDVHASEREDRDAVPGDCTGFDAVLFDLDGCPDDHPLARPMPRWSATTRRGRR
jgi:hypothetical protein